MPADLSVHAFLPRLLEGAWFAQLPDRVSTILLQEGRVVAFSPNERLFARGDRVDGLYAVLEGAIEIGAVDADGGLAVLTIVETSAWFGEIAIVDSLPRTHDATALRPSIVLHVPHRAILALLDREPAFWRELGRLLTAKLRLAFEVTEARARLSAPQRLAARLLMIANGYHGAAAPQQDISLSQDQLATLLSLSRQTVNRILKGFEADGLVALRQGHISLLDPPALDRLAKPDLTGRAGGS